MISVVSAVRDLGRVREITSVLVRHGFGEVVARIGFGKKPRSKGQSSDAPPVSGVRDDALEMSSDELEKGEEEKNRISTAERIRLVLQDLGPSFIKLGQIASTRNDLLPADVIAELRKLQDNVPSVPFEEVKAVIESSLGEPLDKLFVSFDEKPLATASIGQVHRATLATPDGEAKVVVKVQRPNVGETVARDLELLHMMAAALERTIPETRIYSPIGLVQNFDRSITAELNFTIEAENSERFTRNFEGTPQGELAKFPKVHKQASSKHVLALEFFDGVKIDKAAAAGIDTKKVAKNAVGVVIKMVFEDGFFHADPHPGNVIIMRRHGEGGPPEEGEPVIGLIDLGMVGRLSPELRDRTIDLMVAAVRQDSYAVADALFAIGRPTKKIDMREYRAEVSLLAEKYIGRTLKEIDLSAMIRDLVQGAMKYGIEIPPDFMLVGKALMTLEGIAKELDPELDVFGEAQPYFVDLLKKRYSPQRLGNELIRGVEQLSRAGYDVPLQAREVLEDLRLGRLVIKTEDPALPAATDRLGRRLFSGIVVSSFTVSGVLALSSAKIVGIVLLAIAGIMFFAHVLNDLRRAPRRR
ncbi:Ubiquinone biosynthesis monooxygenase UbiB [Labilithrix luteola]|uniref:Ubiquinone biosynthesis monooxygenase UbiB n=1 Tax=Labilithrix luteola TaxID=1391654 RepID=A0A0K1PV23_9BACT|nr:AarF/ABC1/UbiB kinase family protein [Labilithrix luteola]AKU97388.1 Ubiquinone biosynthesis monooxygenase UbiB [Labilithrix luteola]